MASAIQLNSDIQFWCYTRSFFAVPTLCNIPNLNLYLSLDPVNIQHGLTVFSEHKTDKNNLQICYMNSENNYGTHLERAQQILNEENRIRVELGYTPKSGAIPTELSSCPLDEGKLALEGGCAICKRCTRKKSKPIWFKS